MAGTIPIIQRNVLDDAYQHLPVAFVDTWEEIFQPANYTELEMRLRAWMTDLQPYYQEGSALRRKTLDVSIVCSDLAVVYLSPTCGFTVRIGPCCQMFTPVSCSVRIFYSRMYICTLYDYFEQRLKTAYWMEQVHKKVKEYHTLEALRTHNISATLSSIAAPTGANNTDAAAGAAPASERLLLHGQHRGTHEHDKRGLKEHSNIIREQSQQRLQDLQQQQPLARQVRELRAAAIATAQRDGTWLVNPAVEAVAVAVAVESPHKERESSYSWMKWW